MADTQFICDTCDEEFEITWDEEHVVRYCPFCGDLLNEEDEDEEDEDEDEDEYWNER